MTSTRRRIIGVDPGSIYCGWGIVEGAGTKLVHVASGLIRCGRAPLPQRLAQIYDELKAACAEFEPTEAAVEALYHQKNARSALVLGHARGAAILAMAHSDLDVTEYEASVVKKSVSGRGGAKKEQVRQMVQLLLGVRFDDRHDRTDALSVAICHLHQNPQVSRTTL